MTPRLLVPVLMLCAAGACTPTASPTASAAPAASGAGVQECRIGMADATGAAASAMTVTPNGAASADGITKLVVQSPNGRRALCQISAGGKLVKFDMM